MAIFSLFLAVTAISAQQKATNFSGNWELDASKSKLDERMRIESMTLNVSQTDKEIKVESTTKRLPPPADAQNNGGGGGGGGMNRGGGRGGFGDGTVTYSLDGKETKVPINSGGQASGEATVKANVDKDGKLNLNSVRTISSQQMGEVKITTTDVWELSGDGKTLKVKRTTESPRGTQSMDLVFNKK